MSNIDFIGIGAQKAGTSWLHNMLNEHPDVSLLPIKELHYFDRSKEYPSPNKLAITKRSERLANPKWRKAAIREVLRYIKKGDLNKARWFYKWHFKNYNDEWYLSLFQGLNGLKGEITPAYSILNDSDVQSMARLLQNGKLILMLRDPIDRAWSHYRHSATYRNFNVGEQSIEEILDFMDSDDQVLRSNYIRTIQTYLKHFNRNQLLICFFEGIKENPQQLLDEVLDFLNVKAYTINQQLIYKKVNVSAELKMPDDVYKHLKTKYKSLMADLRNTLGSYTNDWYNKHYQDELTADENRPFSLFASEAVLQCDSNYFNNS